jgi:hypothetical protein
MKTRFKISLLYCLLLVFLPCCKKTIEAAIKQGYAISKTGQFVKYTIRRGQHYTDQNSYQAIEYAELKFVVKFDSTAIYQTTEAGNQEDINKLYGFSDNNAQHQQFSVRFGWNWARDALRLYAYTYNNGERSSMEISSIQIGVENNCSIKISDGHYIFSLNNVTVEMSRGSTTTKDAGHKLYPYFGGDEAAPHDINIWIKEL